MGVVLFVSGRTASNADPVNTDEDNVEVEATLRGFRQRSEQLVGLRAGDASGHEELEVLSQGKLGGDVKGIGDDGQAARAGLTIVTNALNIASELALRKNLKLFVTGGVARAESYELLGPLAEATQRGFNLDVVFIGVNGISVRGGATTHEEDDAHTVAALIDHARIVIAVSESAKIGKVTFARICDIERLDELVTDSEGDQSELAAIEAAGVRITLVQP